MTPRVQAPAGEALRVAVYDILGREVVTLRQGNPTVEVSTISWNGLDAQGEPVAQGIYFVYAESAGQITTQAIMKTR